MEFRKYQHIERYGTREVDGIENGLCYVFYKIDGSAGSIYTKDSGEWGFGSRNRELTLDNDNAGFMNETIKKENIRAFLVKYPHLRLFGEWLVKHSLKTYSDDAWNKFYVYDVTMDTDQVNENGKVIVEYLPYDTYSEMLKEFGIEFIPPLAIIKNGHYESFVKCLDKTGQFLIKDGAGKGEGIVIKNYDFYNKYGRQTWAKIVANEFKTIHHKEMGAPLINATKLVEERIIEEFMTEAFIEKEYAKLVVKYDGWSSKYIGEFLGRTMDEFYKEEAYNFIKALKNPKINFKMVYALGINKIKTTKQEIFR